MGEQLSDERKKSGVVHDEGDGDLLVMSLGTLSRVNTHIEIPVEAISMA